MANFKKILLFSIIIFTVFISGCSVDSDPEKNEEDPAKITEIPQVDTAVATFMANHNVPGLALAITKGEKLVYAKSYGKADIENDLNVTNSSLFRIASVSKPVTAIGIMLLVQQGHLSLDDLVFGETGILGTDYGSNSYSNRLTSVTVEHLLHHTAGGWPNDGSDPMFSNPQLSAGELLSWTLDNRPLTHNPGSNYAYSNFGYSILGRIIEKITGITYEQFIQQELLAPYEITQMQIGGNTLAERKTNEVTYYGQGNENPYIYNISRMDAHGGWIASATDLAKLLVHADGFSSRPDILTSSAIQLMTAPSSANANYAAGWAVNSANHWWHTGSLPGTGTIMVRTSLGYNWVVLTNTRSTSPAFMNELDALIWGPVNNSATQWPDQDLF